jgi:hypothetical protein
MNRILYTFIGLFLSSLAIAQHHHEVGKCGTDYHYQMMIQNDPSILERQKAFEAQWQLIQKNNQNTLMKNKTKLIIPVVFHVFHVGGSENISKEQIQDQITLLNQDFSVINFNNLRDTFHDRVDVAEIEFRLASKDPQGNCTDGIVRIYDPVTENGNNSLKYTSVWPTDKYFNIWVVKDINSASSQLGTVLGYAQFPWTGQYATDGILVRHDNIGSIGTGSNPSVGVRQFGRTTTHEAGHWLGLYHPFQDSCFGGDGVEDTPPVASPSFGCNYNRNTCFITDSADYPDMIENYMDYADGSCMSAFTKGQVMLMRNTVQGWRTKLFSYNNLVATGTADPYTPGNCGPQANFYTRNQNACESTGKITFVNNSYNFSGGGVTYNWSFPGGTPATFVGQNPPQVSYNQSGNYDVTLVASKNIAGTTYTDTFTRTEYVDVYAANATWGAGYAQGFEFPVFPVDGWKTYSTSATNWQRVPVSIGSIEGSHALYIRNNSIEDGAIYYLESPTFDLTTTSDPVLSFHYAFAQGRTPSATPTTDQFAITFSTDCGQTWRSSPSIFNKAGNNLGTVGTGNNSPFTNVSFFPSDKVQWRTEILSLNGVPSNQRSNVRFRFEFRSRGGNNFFIDNINIGFPANVEDIYDNNSNFTVYPNPSNSVGKIALNVLRDADFEVSVLDMFGREVENIPSAQLQVGSHEIEINKNAKLAPGTYFVKLHTQGQSFSRKFVLVD